MLYTPTKYDPHFNFNDYYSNSERDYPNAFKGILIYEPTSGEEFLFWRKKCCIWHSMAWDGSLWHTMESMEQLRLTYLYNFLVLIKDHHFTIINLILSIKFPPLDSYLKVLFRLQKYFYNR